VGFSSSSGAFDYDNSNGVTAGSYDFYGVVAHEFSEVMGRILLVGKTVGGLSNSYDALDLFHYSSSGVHTFTASAGGYFSVDGGNSVVNSFNSVVGGDAGDWAGSTTDAYNAYGTPGAVSPISNGDQTALDVIGWDAGSAVSAADLTAGSMALKADGELDFAVNNVGNVAAGPFSVGVYLSTDPVIGTSDTPLGAPLAVSSLGAGASTQMQVSNLLASLTPQATAGTYYLGVLADSAGNVAEANEANNTASLPVILGTSSGSSLIGTSGKDIIVGFSGNDTLTGGGGGDLLRGGSGSDHFVYNSKSDGLDQIVDFQSGLDVLDFSSAGFGKHLAAGNQNTGTLDPVHFAGDGGFTNRTEAFWFNKADSTLYFDSDGSGGAPAVAIVQLTGVATLSSSDVHLV
jgi:Ca2+-binding RTX toxin-like protein